MKAASSLIQNLMAEHSAFHAAFRDLRQAVQLDKPASFEAILTLCSEFLIKYHEDKEERLLYPALRKDPRLRAGGPECVLHYDSFMADRPLESSSRVCGKVGLQNPRPEWSEAALSDKTLGLPLSIPHEDHEAGRVLIRVLRATPPPQSSGELNSRLLILDEFYRLQVAHHRREDGCFFQMCLDLIPAIEWSEIDAEEAPWRLPPASESLSQVIDALTRVGWNRFAG